MKYTVAGSMPAYGAEPGGEVTVDSSDPGVVLSVAAGVLVPVEGQEPKMTCPACADHVKRPPKLSSAEELAAHYGDKHPGLVVPDWKEE